MKSDAACEAQSESATEAQRYREKRSNSLYLSGSVASSSVSRSPVRGFGDGLLRQLNRVHVEVLDLAGRAARVVVARHGHSAWRQESDGALHV